MLSIPVTMHIVGRNISIKKLLLIILLAAIIGYVVFINLRTPTHDRVWIDSQAVLPYATFEGNLVHVQNIRNVEYRSRYDYTTHYYDKTFDLNELETVDYIIEPFASVAAAHTFLSFGFSDGSRVGISAEARREAGEIFNPLLGASNQYEIMYTVVDERDALELRAIHRDNQVLIYPTVVDKENVKRLFVAMLERANQLKEKPEFYNLFSNSCSTNIARHINDLSPGRISWDYRLILPKESDALAYELGLLDTDYTLEELRTMYDATEAIKEHIDDPDFSTAIRSDRPTSVKVQ